MNQNQKIILFQDRKIRRAWHDNAWFFSLVDIVGALTESTNPADYRRKLRKRDDELGFYIGTNCPQVEISQQEQPDSFSKNRQVAQRGGKVAGNARKDTERELGRSVVSEQNYLTDSSIDQSGRLEGGGE